MSDQADHVLAGVLGAYALRLQVSGKFLAGMESCRWNITILVSTGTTHMTMGSTLSSVSRTFAQRWSSWSPSTLWPNLTAEADRDQWLHNAGVDTEPIMELEFDQTLTVIKNATLAAEVTVASATLSPYQERFIAVTGGGAPRGTCTQGHEAKRW